MSAKPVAAEIVAEALGDGMHGQAAGIGGNDGSGLAHGLDLAQQSALEIEIFDHGLDDPVAVGQQAEMVFEVAGGDQAGQTGLHESSRLGLARGIQPGFGNAVADRGRGVSWQCPGERYPAGKNAPRHWPGARRCGNPWFPRRGRRLSQFFSASVRLLRTIDSNECGPETAHAARDASTRTIRATRQHIWLQEFGCRENGEEETMKQGRI